MWYLVKIDQDPYVLNYKIELKSWYIHEVGQWRCTAGLASKKQTASGGSYCQGWRKRYLSVNSCIPGTRRCVDFLEQRNHIWYSRCNWSHHLVKSTIIHCHSQRSICHLHKPNRRVEWGCGGNHHPCIFQVLDGGTNLCNSSRNVILILIYYFSKTVYRQF